MSALTVRVPSRTLRCHLAVGLIALAHPGCERGILASVRELSETPVVTLKGCPAGDARFSLGGSDQLPEQRLGLVAAPFGDELIHGRDPLAVMAARMLAGSIHIRTGMLQTNGAAITKRDDDPTSTTTTDPAIAVLGAVELAEHKP
jgi:hypothetical protein